jgi:hypothetical protein
MDTTTTDHDTTAVVLATPTPPIPPEVLERVLIGGDLAQLTEAQRLAYYRAVCQSLGLNPLSKPFEYLWLNGKLRLYALRDLSSARSALPAVRLAGERRRCRHGLTHRDGPPPHVTLDALGRPAYTRSSYVSEDTL